MQDLRKTHAAAAHKILTYLHKFPEKGLMYRKNNQLSIERYTDANCASDVDDRRSTSGFCCVVIRNFVSCCKSKKQNVVARSSA